jgi:very-short-patch-repair endonuclease
MRFEKGHKPWNKNLKVDRQKYPTMGHLIPHTKESKDLMSEKLQGRIGPNLGKKFDGEWKRNLSISHRGYVMPESQKKRISIGVKNSNHDEVVGRVENRIKHREIMFDRLENGYAPKTIFNTKPELRMKEILKDIGLVDKRDFIFQKRFHNHMIDFWHKRFNLYIFVDGEYWHNYPDYTEKDKSLEKEILDSGAWYIRFWANDIIKNSESVKQKLIYLGVTFM